MLNRGRRILFVSSFIVSVEFIFYYRLIKSQNRNHCIHIFRTNEQTTVQRCE